MSKSYCKHLFPTGGPWLPPIWEPYICLHYVYSIGYFSVINQSFSVAHPLWILDRGVGRKQQGGNRGGSLTAVTSAAFPKYLYELHCCSVTGMGRTAGHRLHIVLAEEARSHASLISDYDSGMFNSGCTAISQPRGRRIIVFSEWLSANTVHRCAFGLLSLSRGWREKVFCY